MKSCNEDGRNEKFAIARGKVVNISARIIFLFLFIEFKVKHIKLQHFSEFDPDVSITTTSPLYSKNLTLMQIHVGIRPL